MTMTLQLTTIYSANINMSKKSYVTMFYAYAYYSVHCKQTNKQNIWSSSSSSTHSKGSFGRLFNCVIVSCVISFCCLPLRGMYTTMKNMLQTLSFILTHVILVPTCSSLMTLSVMLADSMMTTPATGSVFLPCSFVSAAALHTQRRPWNFVCALWSSVRPRMS